MAQSAVLMAQAQRLRDKRGRNVVEARALVEKAETEKREMTAEESKRYDDIMREVDDLKTRFDKLEKDACREDDETDDLGKDEDEENDDTDGSDLDEDGERARKPAKRRPRTDPAGEKRAKLTRGATESEHEYRNRVRRSHPDYHRVWNDYLVNGPAALNSRLAARAIQADSDIVGGYLIAPQEFTAELIKFVDNLLWIRKEATKYTVKSAQSLGAPSLDTDINDADWTSELDTGNEDTAMAFGKRELVPHPLAKRIKVSNRLLRMASVTGGFSADGSAIAGGPDTLVRARLAYKFAVAEEKAFMTGNGVQQALGVFVASTRGISTARDVTTGSSTGFTADGLIAAKYNQKIQYWPKLKWLFHRTGLQLIRQLKDANGQYLWVPGGFGGEADKLLDLPVMMSEYVPNTFTTGLYVGLLGDFSFYWIADSEQFMIQQLVELYAASNQTGYIARMELDGMPVLEEAFTRLKTN